MNEKDLIIHYVFERNDELLVAYEIKGEWRPQTKPLVDLVKNDFPSLNLRMIDVPSGRLLTEDLRFSNVVGMTVLGGYIPSDKPTPTAAKDIEFLDVGYRRNDFVNGLLYGGPSHDLHALLEQN